MALMPTLRRLTAWLAACSTHGIHGTDESSHVQLAWIFAEICNPDSLAAFQCRSARGPGPTSEREYSPTIDFTPPRTIGMSHSLTLCRIADFGSRAIVPSESSSFQPQSQAMSFCLPPAALMPRANVE